MILWKLENPKSSCFELPCKFQNEIPVDTPVSVSFQNRYSSICGFSNKILMYLWDSKIDTPVSVIFPNLGTKQGRFHKS